MNVQLNDIRLKLEEKRRHIESEKRRMEIAMNKQRQKVGKAAFLQAVVKVRLSRELHCALFPVSVSFVPIMHQTFTLIRGVYTYIWDYFFLNITNRGL